MTKLMAPLVGVVGAAVGVLTSRAIRTRKTTPEKEAATATTEAVIEAKAAVDHAAVAVGRARTAVEKGLEYACDEIEVSQTANEDNLDLLRRSLRFCVRFGGTSANAIA